MRSDKAIQWKSGKEFLDFLNLCFSKPNFNLERNNYYKIISKSVQGVSCYFATTNYTPYLQFYFEKERLIYLNGKMSWFEDYQKLRVYDIEKDDHGMLLSDEGKIKAEIFPFIFIQSGVKPIVAPMQIEQYHKFLSKLKSCEVLVVLGYNFNNDDNHINAIIVDWLRSCQNHEIVNFDYNDDINAPRKKLGGFWEEYEEQIKTVRISKGYLCLNDKKRETSFEDVIYEIIEKK